MTGSLCRGTCAGLRLLLFACLWAAAPLAGERTHDNVLLIVADDVGLDRVSAFGQSPTTGPTPTLDLLAQYGVRFSRAYANPICSPTRATILTGRYGFRTGIGSNVSFNGGASFELSQDEFTLAEALAPTHRTAAVGKWHLGNQLGSGYQHPIEAGFEGFAGSKEELGGLTSPPAAFFSWEKNVASVAGNVQFDMLAYSSTDHVDDALAVIQAFGADPWFVQVSFNAAHTPFHVPPEPLSTLGAKVDSSVAYKHRAMVEAMDSEIARLIAGIPSGVLNDTWVIFVADNGTQGQAVSNPALQFKAKGTVYESGAGVPLIISGRGVVQSGRTVDAVVNTTDLFATVLDLAGAGLPTEQLPEDSISLVPYLLDPEQEPLRDIAYTEIFAPNGFGPRISSSRAVIESRYKLVEILQPDGSKFLVMFDLLQDPLETQNLLLQGIPLPLFGMYSKLLSKLFSLTIQPVKPTHGKPLTKFRVDY